MILIAACARISWATGQNDAKNSPFLASAACFDASQLKAQHLHGRWDVRFTPAPAGLPATAELVLVQHPEFSESLSGQVIRQLLKGTTQAALAGDLENGFMLLLDESSDNIRITGTWNAELVPGSCGRQFKGVWHDTSADTGNAPEISVVISRQTVKSIGGKNQQPLAKSPAKPPTNNKAKPPPP